MNTVITKFKNVFKLKLFPFIKQLFLSHKIVALSPNNKLFNKKFLSDFSEYQSFLKAAFRDRRIRNIAITGNHGIGKSSIIRSYETKDRKKEEDIYIFH